MTLMVLSRSGGRVLAGLALASILSACNSDHSLMPTPAIYVGEGAKPMFESASANHSANNIDLLYVTDRAPIIAPDGSLSYGVDRSRYMSFGSLTVDIDGAPSDPPTRPQLRFSSINRIGSFPSTPYDIEPTRAGYLRAPDVVSAHESAVASLQAEVGRRLAQSKRKEIIFFIHGYNTTFEDAAYTTGKIAHFLGGEFVTIMLSWPAGGSKGLMMGYNVDRESGEFAVPDMKKAIRAIATAKGVEKVHFIAHSRGTDVLASALQQLGIETYVAQSSLSARLKVANIVLFAPDIDVDVASSKIFDVASDPDLSYGSGKKPKGSFPQGDLHLTVYSSPNDKALDASQIMFGSIMRLGQLNPKERDPNEVAKAPQDIGLADFIEYEGDGGSFGHAYFLSDPNVNADLVGLIRYGLKAGDPRRPIAEIKRPFWLLVSKQTASQ